MWGIHFKNIIIIYVALMNEWMNQKNYNTNLSFLLPYKMSQPDSNPECNLKKKKNLNMYSLKWAPKFIEDVKKNTHRHAKLNCNFKQAVWKSQFLINVKFIHLLSFSQCSKQFSRNNRAFDEKNVWKKTTNLNSQLHIIHFRCYSYFYKTRALSLYGNKF